MMTHEMHQIMIFLEIQNLIVKIFKFKKLNKFLDIIIKNIFLKKFHYEPIF